MKTLYIDIDEELTEVVGKIDALKGQQLLLVIPKDAIIFNNSINLKILKQKSQESGKELQVFTNDESGQAMLNKVGIRLYHGHLRKRSSITTTQLSKLPIQEVKRVEQRKVSITEISDKTRRSLSKIPLSTPQKKQQRKEQREWSQFFLFSTLRKKTVIGFTILALAFFALVIYVAVPSATIYLSPSSNVLETTVNIQFADPNLRKDLFRLPDTHTLASTPIQLTFEKNILYKPTGRVFTGHSASCNLKVQNERTSSWTLLPKTRFVDNTGVVFRLKDSVEIPAARYQVVTDSQGNAGNEKVSGSLIVHVEADDFDENKNVIGSRGNLIAGTRFSLPGLSAFNQTLISAVNEHPCVGGVTDYYTIVTADDLKTAKQKIQEELQKTARQYLIDFVAGENVKRAEQSKELETISPLLLFDHPQAIHYELIDTALPPDLENQRVEEFSVSGKMKVSGLAYEQQSYFELLEQGLLSKVHPDKILASIDYNSTTLNIVYSDSDVDTLSRIKVSVSVRGVEEYNFDPQTTQGKALVNRILGFVPGKSVGEVKYFIDNLEEIQKSHITVWPFWKNILPERPSSISIKVSSSFP